MPPLYFAGAYDPHVFDIFFAVLPQAAAFAVAAAAVAMFSSDARY